MILGLMKCLIFFYEIDNNRHELHKYNHRTSNITNRENEMLGYLKVIEWNMFSSAFVVRKISNANVV